MINEPATALVGGEGMTWGEDDVFDFLSQFGFVERMTEGKSARLGGVPEPGTLYLSESGREHSHRPYLLTFSYEGQWLVQVYLEEGRHFVTDGDEDDDLLTAVGQWRRLCYE